MQMIWQSAPAIKYESTNGVGNQNIGGLTGLTFVVEVLHFPVTSNLEVLINLNTNLSPTVDCRNWDT